MHSERLARLRRNPYLPLLLTLCCAWLVLGSYSWGAYRMSVLGQPLAKWKPPWAAPSTTRWLPAGRTAQVAGSSRRSGDAPGIAPRLAGPGIDPKPQRILLFGDSMVPVLAPRLADYCLENGHELFPAVWYGSSIMRWAWHDDLDKLLVELDPSMVIAALGSTELTVRDVGECEPYVGILARKVGRRKLVWIGPPNWRPDTGVNALLAEALGETIFFHSGAIPFDRGPDGIHPSARGGAQWVDAFVGWLGAESAYPIKLAPPTREAPRPAARVIRTPL